jgi:AraC-like DNA-binding protein
MKKAKELNLINRPAVRTFLYVADTDNPRTALHYHSEMEFIAVYNGSVSCTVRGDKYVAKEGEVLFVNSGVPHSIDRQNGSRILHMQLSELDFTDSEKLSDLYYAALYKSQVVAPAKVFNNEKLFSAIDEIYRETEEKLPAASAFIRSGILRILAHLYRDGILYNSEEIFNTRELQKLLPAIRYINENYVENIALETVSELIGFDQSYFCRVFKSTVGTTFTEYLNFVKILKAEEKLLDTRDAIFDISRSVGFASVSYFNRIFKRFRSCSPRFYRSVVSLRA